MKLTRAVAILLLSFLAGGSSAEMAVQTHRALAHRTPAMGSAGDLVALELRDGDGELLARPRMLAVPGKLAHLVLRDPENADRVRLDLRVATTREPSGEVSLDYSVSVGGEPERHSGRIWATPGVEYALDLGDRPMTATLLTLPVPSAAFDAFLEAERARRAWVRAT
jgi:hypothetical protein